MGNCRGSRGVPAVLPTCLAVFPQVEGDSSAPLRVDRPQFAVCDLEDGDVWLRAIPGLNAIQRTAQSLHAARCKEGLAERLAANVQASAAALGNLLNGGKKHP